MISLKRCRELAPSLRDLPDEQVRQVLEDLYAFAELSLKCGSKYPSRVLPRNENRGRMKL